MRTMDGSTPVKIPDRETDSSTMVVCTVEGGNWSQHKFRRKKGYTSFVEEQTCRSCVQSVQGQKIRSKYVHPSPD